MKKASLLLAFFALSFAGLVLAQGAVATSVTGAVQAQTGAAAPRAVRQGDEVRQGDTVSTAANSSVVLKFDDGQVVALTGNSRMTVTAYQYNPQARTGNVLISLINGGMRAITGLIGRNQPERVAYRAATATIGIRGTDGIIVTDGVNVAVTVSDGVMTFTVGTETIVIPAGQGALLSNGRISPATIQQVYDQLSREMRDLVNGLQGLTESINRAFPGVARGDPEGQTLLGITPGTVPPGGSAGGGGAASPQ